jgi:hypothetical protein
MLDPLHDADWTVEYGQVYFEDEEEGTKFLVCPICMDLPLAEQELSPLAPQYPAFVSDNRGFR